MTPQIETARLIRAYVDDILTEQMGDGDGGAYDHLLDAIMGTDTSDAEACCHMGRALLCLHHGLSDPLYRLGGTLCDTRLTEISRRLGVAG